MDSLYGLLSSDSAAASYNYSLNNDDQESLVKELKIAESDAIASANSQIIRTISAASANGEDTVSVSFQDLYKGLSITGKQIVDAINQQLGEFLPNGVQSLKPEDVTPEATADRIVTGVTAYFDAYAAQHKDLEGEELIDSFMQEIRKGIGTGYDDAVKILDGLGAFSFDGVKDGIEKTKSLIEEKLVAFENQKRKEMGLSAAADSTSADSAGKTRNEIASQAGASVNVLA